MSRASRWRAAEFALTAVLLLALVWLGSAFLLRHDLRWDFSEGQRRTLAPQTRAVLEKLDRPVEILGFYAELPEEQARLRSLVDLYREQTGLLTLQFVDADRRPDLAELHGVTTNRTVVLVSGDLRVRLHDPDEAMLTGGLVRIMQEVPPLVLFTTGHGEASLEDSAGGGLQELGKLLTQQNFEVRLISTAAVRRIPPEASVLVLAGPQGEFDPGEIARIEEYLERGGRVLAMVEPGGAPAVDTLLAEWGVVAENGYVLDVSQERRNLTRSDEPLFALALGGNPEHPVTRGFNYATVYPIARSLRLRQPLPAGVKATRLVETGAQSWLERGEREGEAPDFDDGIDRRGPLALAYALEIDLRRFATRESRLGAGLTGTLIEMTPTADIRDPSAVDTARVGDLQLGEQLAQEARAIVFGDTDFVSNANLRVQGNSDLFLASILWLSEQEDRIALAPRPNLTDPILLTARQISMVRWIGIFGVPAVLFLFGVLALWQRRRWV